MAPRVGRVVDHDRARPTGVGQVGGVLAVLAQDQRCDAAAGRIELQPHVLVLEERVGRADGRRAQARRVRHDPVRPVAERRQVDRDRHPAAPRGHRRVRLRRLERHRRAGLIDEAIGGLQPAELELDDGPKRPGVRVEHEDRECPGLGGQVHQAAERLDREVLRAGRDRRRLAELVARVVVGRFDGRSPERVVELVEEDLLPRPGELGSRIGESGHSLRDRGPRLGRCEDVLGAPVPALDPRVRRIAAHRVVLEVLADHGQLSARLADRLEEPGGRAVAEARHGPDAIEAADAVEVLAGRAAAVVADPVEGHHLGPAVGQLGDRLVEVVAEVLAWRAVLMRQAEGEHA